MIWYLALFFLFSSSIHASSIEEANQKYFEAERAKDVTERKKLFNDALTLYLRSEPQNPSEKFCYNIANTYFQLGEYGYAILYYNKGLKVSPRDARIQNNLLIAMQKAGLSPPSSSFIKDYLLSFHYDLSHNEKVTTCLILFFLIFALLSLHIWSKQQVRVYKQLSLCCIVIASAFILSIIWANYLQTPVAVIIHPTGLRIDAGSEYKAVANAKVLPGMKVDVLASENNGAWLRVRLPSNQEGYVGKENARVI